jgi:hypothetical protein
MLSGLAGDTAKIENGNTGLNEVKLTEFSHKV